MSAWWNKWRAALAPARQRPGDPVPGGADRHGYPSTFGPAGGGEQGVARVNVFDPALKQYRSAFRPGDPALADATAATRWRVARRCAMEHVLRLIVTAPSRRRA